MNGYKVIWSLKKWRETGSGAVMEKESPGADESLCAEETGQRKAPRFDHVSATWDVARSGTGGHFRVEIPFCEAVMTKEQKAVSLSILNGLERGA